MLVNQRNILILLTAFLLFSIELKAEKTKILDLKNDEDFLTLVTECDTCLAEIKVCSSELKSCSEELDKHTPKIVYIIAAGVLGFGLGLSFR